jgi:hypothetical protein
MTGDPKLTRLRTRYRFAEHRIARGPAASGALGKALKGARDGQHASGHLDTAEDGVLGRNYEITIQGEFEATPKGDAANHDNGWNTQSLYRPLGVVRLSNKRAEPVNVLAGPVTHFATETETWPFRSDHQHTNVAFAGFVHRLLMALGKAPIKKIAGRIC